ncbi:hypothetical protein F503_05940 [Ophiostoma piceae UAMH 11346]|uniref:Uncharacterized protein n=1 Tax=Ophiostoma piceae (strain UAMH 11346) TaxID=1262450 RepID=S3DBB9_OPHP1|nr:hypothetical protein F503_05940 [Ophiostoma piceae UAMH 11346]
MGMQSGRQVRAALSFVAKPLLLAIILTVVARALFSSNNDNPEGMRHAETIDQQGHTTDAQPRTISRALVVASTSDLPPHDTAWLSDLPSEWQGSLYNYVTDKPLSPELAVPANKGNEAMAYMTYIIDHYDALPDVVLFHHGHRHGWHQALDSPDEVRRLRVEYVQKKGYVSLRCLPGCENVIALADYAVDQSLFPGHGRAVQLTSLLDDFLDRDDGERVPVRLASPCCAQFAASREAIQRRPRAWWVSLRKWLIETPLLSMDSGRLMEYTWHVWLGSESVYCPDFESCQCHVFGIGQCDEYFALEESM